jgi:hypothetical protein
MGGARLLGMLKREFALSDTSTLDAEEGSAGTAASPRTGRTTWSRRRLGATLDSWPAAYQGGGGGRRGRRGRLRSSSSSTRPQQQYTAQPQHQYTPQLQPQLEQRHQPQQSRRPPPRGGE